MAERVATDRIEAFSDGVFAIAITLLVLEISVPEEQFDDLWKGIVDEWPSYLAYATSFLTIGGLWLAHHAIFRRLEFADSAVIRINLLLLMAVAFLPFPTNLMAESLTTEAERPAVLFYGATLLVIATLITAICRYALARGNLVPESGADLEAVAARMAPSLGFYGVFLVLAIVAPEVAVFGFLVIAVGTVVPLRRRRTQ